MYPCRSGPTSQRDPTGLCDLWISRVKNPVSGSYLTCWFSGKSKRFILAILNTLLRRRDGRCAGQIPSRKVFVHLQQARFDSGYASTGLGYLKLVGLDFVLKLAVAFRHQPFNCMMRGRSSSITSCDHSMMPLTKSKDC